MTARLLDPHQAEIFEAAEAALVRRRLLGRITFTSPRQALIWYFEESTLRNQVKSPVLDCDRDYNSVKASVPVHHGRLQDPEEAFVVLFTIHAAFERFYVMNRPKGRAVTLTLRDGVSQVEAARQCNVDQGTISRWVGDCEEAIALKLREAEILR